MTYDYLFDISNIINIVKGYIVILYKEVKYDIFNRKLSAKLTLIRLLRCVFRIFKINHGKQWAVLSKIRIKVAH
ncbi:MAG: hypothetical protein LBL77_02225 [Endomicrobium sp.]|nr:hypothetical protein [Endomicrobium sp.]